MKLKDILTHPLFLVVPWTFVAIELDRMTTRRRRTARKRSVAGRQRTLVE